MTTQLRDLLEAIGYEEEDQIVLATNSSGAFTGVPCSSITNAEDALEAHNSGDVWVTVNRMRPIESGRGTDADVVEVKALWLDLDYKPSGAKDVDTAQAIVDDISQVLQIQPVAQVHSGGGLQPYWRIDGGEDVDRARVIIKRFRMLAERVADNHEAKVDNVFDLPRVMRAPGSFNRKLAQPRPVTLDLEEGPESIALDDLEARLDDAGIPTPSVEEARQEVMLRHDEWQQLGDESCHYVKTIIEGLPEDTPEQRHPWSVKQVTRCAAAERLGCLHRGDLPLALQGIADRLRVLFRESGEPQSRIDQAADEVRDAYLWAVQHVERMTDEECRAELGNHNHDRVRRRWEHDREEWDLGEAPGAKRKLFTELGREDGPLSGFFKMNGDVYSTACLFKNEYHPPVASHIGQEVLPTDVHRLSVAIELGYETFKIDENGERKSSGISDRVLTQVLRTTDYCENLRVLEGITRTPILRRDYSVQSSPGYADGYLYLPDPGSEITPTRATPKDILEPFSQFPWVSPQDRFNYLAALMMPMLLPAVPNGTMPLLIINAHQPGSGKTLLAESLTGLWGGNIQTEPKGEEEKAKVIASQLSVPDVVLVWDNIKGTFSSSTMEGLLTSPRWSGRRLGTNEVMRMRNNRLWVLTGNNVAVADDMMRRTLWVSIDPKMPNPHMRTGFDISDLVSFVQKNRDGFLSDILGLIVQWRDAGAPMPTQRPSDSYGVLDLATSILNFHGMQGDARDTSNQPNELSESDQETLVMLQTLDKHFEGRAFTAREVFNALDRFNRDDLGLAMPAGHQKQDETTPVSVGRILRNRVGRMCPTPDGGAVWLESEHDQRANVRTYQVGRRRG